MVTVDALRKTLKKHNSPAFAWLADLMRQCGDVDGALACAQNGVAAFPENVEGRLILSSILFEKEDWDGVVQACEFVLLRDPFCLSALRRMGDAYDKKGDVAKRNLYYRYLHDLDPLDSFWKEEYAPAVEMPASSEPVQSGASESAPAEPSLDDLMNEVPLSGLGLEKTPETLMRKPEPEEQPAQPAVKEGDQSLSADEDPFSALATLLPSENSGNDDASFASLEHSLDDAIAGFAPASSDKEDFPSDEINGDDISSALSGIFGASESAEPEREESPAPSNDSTPAVAASGEAPAVEDKPKSLSDAFDDIFGEDELPEEFVPSKPMAAAQKDSTDVAGLATSAEEPASEKPLETESPEQETSEQEISKPEIPETESLEQTGLKSEISEPETPDLELPAAESTSATETPSEESSATLETSVESSFDNLFGKDADDSLSPDGVLDLDAPSPELPVADESASSAEVTSPEKPLETESPEQETSEQEISKPEIPETENLEQDGLKPEISEPETPDLELPAAESTPATEAPSEESSATLETSVESSFDNLFGKDADDSLSPDGVLDLDAPSPELPVADESASSAEVTSPEKPLETESPEQETSEPEISKPEIPETENLEQTGLKSEISEPETPDLELPATEAPSEESSATLETSVESSFDNLFGKDADDLPLEDLKLDGEAPSAKETPTAETLSGSVDSSFDSLFGKNSDDALEEDPTTSTRTLAEIYFEQGVYDEAIKIYNDLIHKSPESEDLQKRLAEIKKIRDEKSESTD